LASCPVVNSGPDDLKNSSFALDTVIFPSVSDSWR
jgi:hypothetical protein